MIYESHPAIDRSTLALILFAGVNVGLIGAVNFDILRWIFGWWEWMPEIVIGVAAVWQMLRQRY